MYRVFEALIYAGTYLGKLSGWLTNWTGWTERRHRREAAFEIPNCRVKYLQSSYWLGELSR